MVKLFTLLLIAISFSGFSQVYQNFNAYGWEVNRIKINGGLTLPTYAGLPSIGTVSNSSVNLRGALIYNTNDSTIYGWSGTQWRAIGSGGGGGTWGSITGTLSSQTDLQTALNAKQATLVSSTNIKTLGGQSLLGSGDFGVNAPLEIVGGSGVSLGITQAGSSGDGYLSSTDWNTFNNKKNADDSTTANPANYVTQYQRNKLRDSLAGLIGLSGYYYADGTFNTDRNVAGANKRLTYTDLRHLVVEANEKITLTASTVGLMANDSLKINIGPSLPTAGQVLTTSATGRATWQTPSASGWNLTGNSGTTAGTNFIGTTDFVDLVFKWGGQEAGRIGGLNTSFGNLSALNMASGTENTAFGHSTLQENTSGNYNTALGYDAIASNTTGSRNVGIGHNSLLSAVATSDNTGIGYRTLGQLSTGNSNIGIGSYAGYRTNTQSNKLYINNQDRTTAAGDSTLSLVYGVMAATIADQKLRINGHLQINDSTQGAGKVLTSDANGIASWQTPSGGGGLTGLTTGGILFGGSLGNAVQNSSKLYIDSINNFVGIGTNTPGATLHIKPKSSSLTPVIIDSLGTYTNTGYAKLAGVPGNGLFKTSTGVLMIRPAKPAMATIDTLVYDDFNRATLGSNYDTTGSGFTTVLSGGKLTLSTSTSNTNTDRFLRYKGYGYSTMRSFKTTIWYRQPTARASSTYGAVVGAYSMRNPGQKCTSVGVTDFSTNFGPGLNHFALTSTGSANIVTSSTSGIPAMSTTNLYRLDFEVKKDSAYTTLTNVTAGTSKVLSYKYDFTSTSQDATKPNFFYYAFGINNGGTNATTIVIDSFLVTTTEKKNVDIVFVGNSITTGYYGGTADSAFAEKLKTNTTKTIQILAGGYNQSVDAVLNLPEILNQNPDTAFFCLGTNDISGSVPTATTMAYLAAIYTSCVDNGTFPVFFTVPNGGNTLSGGGLNQSIAAAYPSNYVDLWTLFFNAYPGEMVDSVHPNAAGMRRIQGIIKAAYPSLFPL